MTKILFTAVKNEAPFLLEWVAYHRAIGFERIVIFSNDSDDGTTELLDALAHAGEVEHHLQVIAEGIAPQANAAKLMNDAGIVQDGDWVLWLDADEFLNIHVGSGQLDDLIAAMAEHVGILLPWRVFGDSGHQRFTGRFISDDFTGAAARDFEGNLEIKTLFKKTRDIKGFGTLGIHRPVIAKKARIGLDAFVGGDGQALLPNSKTNQEWISGRNIGKNSVVEPAEFGWGLAQINHYMVRTPEMFELKKIRGRGWKRQRAGTKNRRHTDAFYEQHNRNEAQDRSILRHLSATDAGLARLRKHPEIPQLEAMIAQYLGGEIKLMSQETAPDMEIEMPKPPVDAPAEEPRKFELTLPVKEAELVRKLYAEVDVVLEYGSGGSTFIAAEVTKRKVFSVESDKDWAEALSQSVKHHFPKKEVHIHHADIGPTKEWGHPKNPRAFQQFPGYPLSVWDLPEFEHPDLVLIDGRFRAACFLTVLFKITKPTTVLWDDYIDRFAYHEVEDLAKPVEMVGRMARFELTPMAIPADKLLWVVQTYLRAF